jgi:hypothetical protein
MTPEELKLWRSTTPIHITHDEDGNPLAEVTGPIATCDVIEADEEELVLVDIDEDGHAEGTG